MKRIITITLLLLFLLSNTAIAFAKDDSSTYSEVPTVGIPATQDGFGFAEGSSAGTRSMMDIIDWRNHIKENTTGEVELFAKTECLPTADKIEHYVILQQWNGSSWITYSTSLSSKSNTTYYENFTYSGVQRDKYYRIKTYHRAYLGSTIADSEILYSTYIYVD